MPLGRRKQQIRFAFGFSSLGSPFQIPSPQSDHALFLPAEGVVMALVRVLGIPAGVETIVKAGDTAKGYELRFNGANVEAVLYGAGPVTKTAQGIRALTADDVNKWLLVGFGGAFATPSPLGLRVFMNGQAGTATSLVGFGYGTPVDLPIFIGCSTAAMATSLNSMGLAQVLIAHDWELSVLTSDVNLVDHYEASRDALRIEEMPGTQFYVDFGVYEGPLINAGGTLVKAPAFGDLVRGARIEPVSGASGAAAVGMLRADRATDWVTV